MNKINLFRVEKLMLFISLNSPTKCYNRSAMNIYILHNNDKKGPYPLNVIQAALDNGKITPSHLAWHDGLANWVPVTQISGIKSSAVPPPSPTSGTALQQTTTQAWGIKKTLVNFFLCLFYIALAMVGIRAFYYFLMPKPTPYDSWDLVDKETNKRVIKNPYWLKFEVLDNKKDPESFADGNSYIVTNGFDAPVSKIVVTINYINTDRVSIGQQEQSTGAMEPGQKWKLSFTPIPGASFTQVADTYAYEAL